MGARTEGVCCGCLVLVLALGMTPGAEAGGGRAKKAGGTGAIAEQTAVAGAMGARLSDMGPDGDEFYDAARPAVAFNGIDGQYLIVWEGDDNLDGLVADEIEIRGQLIDAGTGLEIGADDFVISRMGPDGDPAFGAFRPSVAFNRLLGEYLVVWQGNDGSGGLADTELEIWGRLLDASGAALGPDFRISAQGPDGDPAYEARNPRVAYNEVGNEYLVVWQGDATPGELEIFGQLLDADGAQIGPGDFRISDLGRDGRPGYDALNPAVAWGEAANRYLVVWEGDDNSGALVNGEFEIFGQLIQASTGLEVGLNDFQITDPGTDGMADFDASAPAVAYNDIDGEFLVVWSGDGPPLPDGKFEIMGQRIDAASGTLLEPADVLISSMGDPGDAGLSAQSPAVSYCSADAVYVVVWHGDTSTGGLADNELEIWGSLVSFPFGALQFRLSDMGADDGDADLDARNAAVVCEGVGECLVVWEGDDDTGTLGNDQFEIFGQRLASVGAEVGDNDVRISSAGPDGDLAYDADFAEVACNGVNHEYLVVWEGDDDTSPLVEGRQVIFGQRVDAISGAEVGANDFQISFMGPAGDPEFHAIQPAVAYNSTDNLYLVVWAGETNTGGLVDEEFEIWGQLIDGATGAAIGSNFRISDAGPDGFPFRDALRPAVAYGSTVNRFLVAWEADDSDVGTPNHKNEIYAQLIDGATGAEVGPNDIRVSDMSHQDDAERDGREPAVAFNPNRDEFLVAWRGEEDYMAVDEYDIFGQRIDAVTGEELGANDFRISDMGPDNDTDYDAVTVAVAHNIEADEYLVVWRGDDDTNGLVDNEFEIFGQRLGATGAEIGPNDFRISDMGPLGDPLYNAVQPSIAYNPAAGEYLVLWEGNDDAGAVSETEIYAQRLDGSGSEVGADDLRITFFGADGSKASKALDPAVAYDDTMDRYYVAWSGDEATGAMINDELEIFGGLLGGTLCAADLDGSGAVGISDLIDLLAQWGTDPGGPPDLDGDGTVGITDLLELLASWGACP